MPAKGPIRDPGVQRTRPRRRRAHPGRAGRWRGCPGKCGQDSTPVCTLPLVNWCRAVGVKLP